MHFRPDEEVPLVIGALTVWIAGKLCECFQKPCPMASISAGICNASRIFAAHVGAFPRRYLHETQERIPLDNFPAFDHFRPGLNLLALTFHLACRRLTRNAGQ